MIDLDKLGMRRRRARRASSSAFTQAYGAVLVTGPTGSGKSTTLYAALGELNTPEKNIITIEDPVEYQLDGHHAGPGQPDGRPDLRHRPALDDARRPRHHHGRRDPRPRDGADRDRGRAHRPPRALHAAHQRRADGDHAPDRDGRSSRSSSPRRSTASSPSASRARSARPARSARSSPAEVAARARLHGARSTSRPTSRSAARAAAASATRAASASTR